MNAAYNQGGSGAAGRYSCGDCIAQDSFIAGIHPFTCCLPLLSTNCEVVIHLKEMKDAQRLFRTSATAAIADSRLTSASRPVGVSVGVGTACAGRPVS
jgi:hypothetical protein